MKKPVTMTDDQISDWHDAIMTAFPGALTQVPTARSSPTHRFAWEWALDVTSPVTRARLMGKEFPVFPETK